MGMSRTLYLGTYLLAPHVAQVQHNTAYRCSRQCGQTWPRAEHRFCMACGAPVEPVRHEQSQMRPLLPHTVAGGQYEDDFFVPESGLGKAQCLWLPNRAGFGEFVRDVPVEELRELDLPALAAQKERLLQEYAPLLASVRQTFDVELLVQVGALAYWS